MKRPCVYIIASGYNGTIYVGVTSDINDRMAKHYQGLFDGFTKRYRVTDLVYFEHHHSMVEAIAREKQIKKWNRLWKIRLIEQMNPGWRNLFDAGTGEVSGGPADGECTQ